MSTAQILEELPRLTVDERSRLFARLAELHEADLLEAGGPGAAEREALDAAFTAFENDARPGSPWREVFAQVRHPRR